MDTGKLDLGEFMVAVHQNAIDHGWYEEPRTFGDVIALMHSELSEALEEFRAGHDFKETYYSGKEKPEGIPSELADVIIRVLDTCAYYGIDIVAMLKEKHEFNKSRPYKHGNKVI